MSTNYLVRVATSIHGYPRVVPLLVEAECPTSASQKAIAGLCREEPTWVGNRRAHEAGGKVIFAVTTDPERVFPRDVPSIKAVLQG